MRNHVMMHSDEHSVPTKLSLPNRARSPNALPTLHLARARRIKVPGNRGASTAQPVQLTAELHQLLVVVSCRAGTDDRATFCHPEARQLFC
jgi:hypothetical protein